MHDSFPFSGPPAIRRWRQWLSLAIAMFLGIAVARAQDDPAGRFLPLPEGVPAVLFDGLSTPDDPSEIAHEIRGSVLAAASAPAPTDQLLGGPGVEPAALTGAVSTAAVEASIDLELGGAATAEGAVISVIVENVETSSGTVNIGLCDKGLSRDTCPYDKEVRASEGFVEATFESIPPGSYAIVAYHDVNGNGQFDRILGMPREPYALSGRAAAKMVPSFDDAVLPIHTGENAVVIRLKRLVGG